MRKTLLATVLLSFIVATSYSQDTTRVTREIGLTFSNLNSFGLRYKRGRNNTFLRLTLASINLTSNKTTDTLGTNQKAFNLNFNVGVEKRKVLNRKLTFYYGFDLLTGYSGFNNNYWWRGNETDTKQVFVGLGFVCGLYYKISDAVFLSGELIPQFRYTQSTSKDNTSGTSISNTTKSYSASMTNAGAVLTLAYRF